MAGLFHLGQLVQAGLQFFVSGNIIRHFSVVELFVGHHVKVAGAGETKDDGLFFPGFLAFFSLRRWQP